jgi:phosphonopyruvate decarboxylase
LVLVVTGDGELLMNVGALATVAVQQPANLAVLCLDNGYYGLTGGQVTHTASGTDLEAMARAAGIRATMTCTDATHLAAGAALLRDTGSTSFVLAKVKPDPSPRYPVERDGPTCRIRFRSAVLARK